MPYLTPDAKNQLSRTIRSLRDRLLTDLHNAAESTYRLSIDKLDKAELAEEPREKRRRLEDWLDEQVRAEAATLTLKGEKLDKAKGEIRDRTLHNAIKLAAATLLNRLIVIRQKEALGLLRNKVVTGGWSSPAYREFRDFAPDLCKDDTEGYSFLLSLLYDELALDLPGLFGKVGLTELFPIPASTLRAVVDALDALDPDTWRDDTTLGWVYQYWNDPEREALDDKLNSGGKVEPHEIASKTQMFTERYMVEWLLHNSLGQQWLAICQHNGWTPDVVVDGTLDRLEKRRQDWREKRDRGEVALDALMPIESEQEERWKYWVKQPTLTGDKIPTSIRHLKILDPACGSGHFLIIAFGLLFAFYQEEARHRGETWSDPEIVEAILTHNLHGLDLDPRAVQIAAAALYLKAKALCPQAELKVLNLVASNLNLAALPEDDPALVELRQEVTASTGIPEELTNQIVQGLKGADAWGSLLKVDDEVDRAIAEYERQLYKQGELFTAGPLPLNIFPQGERPGTNVSGQITRDILIEKLERFLTLRTRGDDLGLRLRGEQLAAGVRFLRLVREGAYDLVIGNPPYQGTSKMKDAKYVAQHYKRAKADLYAAFLQRGLELSKPGGLSALLTMRNWMFISQYSDIREWFCKNAHIRLIGDLHFGAFAEMKDVSVGMSIIARSKSNSEVTVFIRPVKYEFIVRDAKQIPRNISGLICPFNIFKRPTSCLECIRYSPLIYWWNEEFLSFYCESQKLESESPVKQGMATGDNARYLKSHWEVERKNILTDSGFNAQVSCPNTSRWVPFIKGAADKKWFEPLSEIVDWRLAGACLAHNPSSRYGRAADYYFQQGVAFSMIGTQFSARAHRFSSVIGDKGASVFPNDVSSTTCLLNSYQSREIMISLNPSVSFQVGDVNRLPLFPIESAAEIFAKLDRAFTEHEAARETSVEFQQPGPSCWAYAQAWAQQAVDRPPGAPLPDWQPQYDQPPAVNWVSYAVGRALGRFPLNSSTHPPCDSAQSEPIYPSTSTLPHGILYLSTYSGDRPDSKDSLPHPACQPLQTAWAEHGSAIASGKPLRDWLRLNFFKDVHVGMYEQRPIYFPLSSEKKNFVVFIAIHRWQDSTLTDLLAEYLVPEQAQLDGEIADLLGTKGEGDTKAQASAEKRYTELMQLKTELDGFIQLVRQCAEVGPPPTNASDPQPEVATKYRMDLDDGVMINSAALWPLLAPQWNKPKKWWSELCTAKGRKDYDWAHLAARYFPQRVDTKCQSDPSLAVAHGCFWQYHPAKAYEWELRLQDEIGPDFTIDEAGSDTLRQQFEAAHPQTVAELREKEEKRRAKKYKKEHSAQTVLKLNP